MTKKSLGRKNSGNESREERLAESLRANLRRRKAAKAPPPAAKA